MLAVGRAEAVLVLVGLVEGLGGEERAVVALLQLHRVRAAQPRLAEELLRLLDRALVVVADLGDDVTLGVGADLEAVNRQRGGTRHPRSFRSPTGGPTIATRSFG